MFSKKKTVYALLGLVFALVIILLPVPEALDSAAKSLEQDGHTAMIVIAALVWAITWWVGEVIPDWCTALGLNCIWIVLAKLPSQQVYAAFAKETVWLIVGAFSLGAAVVKSGILHRIALFLMRLFPATYRGQVIALISTGLICSPLMPSSTAKVLLGAKMSSSVSDVMGFDTFSSGRTGLFLASWTGFGLLAPTFLSASFLSYTVLGALPTDYQSMTWIQWLLAMLPWCLFITASMYVTILRRYRPDSVLPEMKKESRTSAKLSGKERTTVFIMSACLLLWMLEKQIGISASTVAVAGGICCFVFGVLDRKEISTAVPWGFVIFVGVVSNMGEVLTKVGVSAWMMSFLTPLVENCGTPFVLLPIIFGITVFLRFVIASQTAVLVLVVSLLAPVGVGLGIHPVILGMVSYTAVSCWPMLYQNPTYRSALEGTEGKVRHADTLPAAIFYLLAALAASVLCIPYWSLLGYISL